LQRAAEQWHGAVEWSCKAVRPAPLDNATLGEWIEAINRIGEVKLPARSPPASLLSGAKAPSATVLLFPKPEHCQYPVSADRPWRLCGEPAADGTSWCEEHKGKVFAKRQEE
jgi:hypothetical protein